VRWGIGVGGLVALVAVFVLSTTGPASSHDVDVPAEIPEVLPGEMAVGAWGRFLPPGVPGDGPVWCGAGFSLPAYGTWKGHH
jgi:hypothetical protein